MDYAMAVASDPSQVGGSRARRCPIQFRPSPYESFSQGNKDIVRWAYNTFATVDVLSHIAIVFTCCFDAVARPNRERKQTEYRREVQAFLRQVASVPECPEIPVFFVDSADLTSVATNNNMIQLHGWLVNRQPISTANTQEVALRDEITEERQDRVACGYRYSGPEHNQYRYQKYENRVRQKIRPYNGDPVRYGEWRTVHSWEEPAGHQTIEEKARTREQEIKEVKHEYAHSMFGRSCHDHTHFQIYRNKWTETWTVKIDFDGRKTETTPTRSGSIDTRMIEADGWDRGFTPGYVRDI
jgi:hypothetical protein